MSVFADSPVTGIENKINIHLECHCEIDDGSNKSQNIFSCELYFLYNTNNIEKF